MLYGVGLDFAALDGSRFCETINDGPVGHPLFATNVVAELDDLGVVMIDSVAPCAREPPPEKGKCNDYDGRKDAYGDGPARDTHA